MRHPKRSIPIQPITHIWERHREMARRLVAGERPIDIANSMGMTQSRFSIISNSPIFKQMVTELSTKADQKAQDVQSRLKEEAKEAVSYLSKVLRNDKDVGGVVTPALRASVAKDILDRAGHGKVQKVHTINENIYLTGNRIEELKQKRNALLGGVKVIEAQAEA